ncbi:hypothetical protein GCM10025857_29120 [Alicyclobacillus contaminans]|nr:hypothetical protein GCM10025857_29120 [Alicyclobacillus contaminans]
MAVQGLRIGAGQVADGVNSQPFEQLGGLAADPEHLTNRQRPDHLRERFALDFRNSQRLF